MSGNLLDIYPSGATIYALFASYGSSGQSITLTGLAVTDVEIYKNGSVTQRASDAGITLLDTDGIDFDALTGIHGISIDLADNTDAGFYAVGSQYTVVVSAVTIDAQTVSFILGSFRIVAAEAVAGKPKVDVDAWLGTAAATPTVAGVPEVDVTHFNGTVGTFASGRPEVSLGNVAHGGAAATLTALSIAVSNSAGSALTLTSTGGNGHGAVLQGNGSGEGLKATGGANGHGAEFLGGATSGDGIRAAASAAGNGILAEGVGASGAGIWASGDPGIEAFGDLTNSHGFKAEGAGTGAGFHSVGGAAGHGMSLVGGVTSGDGLKAIATTDGAGIHAVGGATVGDGLTAQAAADGAGISASGVGGSGIAAAGNGSGDGIRAIGGATGHGMALAGGATSGNGLNATVTSGNEIDANITGNITGNLSGSVGSVTGAVASVTAAVSISAAAVDLIWDEATAGHATAGSTGKALTDAGSAGDPWGTALPGAYGAGTAGKIVGDNLNATVSSRASQTSLDTVDDFLDTEMAAVKAKTDSLSFTAAGFVDANVLLVSGSADADDRLRRGVLTTVLGTVGVGSTTTNVIASSTSPVSSVNDQFKGRIMIFAWDTTTAALRGQATDITAYTNATGAFTVTALTTAPASGDSFVVV